MYENKTRVLLVLCQDVLDGRAGLSAVVFLYAFHKAQSRFGKDSSRSAGLRKRIMMLTLWLEETAMVVYAFDVDETLEVSKGPVKLFDLVKLREHGHIVGLCGNWAMVTLHCPDWHHICSFVGPCGIEKHDLLRQLRQYIPGHDDYVMVGNILGISGASDDRGAAERAGWRFIQESEFARGVR